MPLLLDAFDDPGILTRRFNSIEEVPALLKHAHIPPAHELAQLPGHLFALPEQRKYAALNAGTTALQILALHDHAAELHPTTLSKVASHLRAACQEYGVETPAWLEKAAMLSPAGAVQLFRAPGQLAKGYEEAKANAPTVSAANKAGVLLRPSQFGTKEGAAKQADLTGTPTMPQSKPLPGPTDVKIPVTNTPGKTASRFALGERYPLDTFADISRAFDYFEKNAHLFDPADRREYARNVAERAGELDLQPPALLSKYAAAGYAPPHEIALHLGGRESHMSNPAHIQALHKLAALQPRIEPELFCATLGELDKLAGLDAHYDGRIADPYYVTYGAGAPLSRPAPFLRDSDVNQWKTAEGDPSLYRWTDGHTTVSGPELNRLARRRDKLLTSFSEETTEEFMKDPITVFSSLPDPEKRVLTHLAQQAD